MQLILGLMFACIFVYIGVNLSLGLNDAVEKATETANTTAQTATGLSAISSLIIPIVFILAAALVVSGVVKQMSEGDGRSTKTKEIKVKIDKNEKSLLISIKRQSEKLEQYLNNLDELLGIKTVIEENCKNGLYLNIKNELLIDDNECDWYIVEKHPEENIFKVVGLHKKDKTQNLLYVLGNTNGKPFLNKIPVEYIEEENINRCLEVAKVS